MAFRLYPSIPIDGATFEIEGAVLTPFESTRKA